MPSQVFSHFVFHSCLEVTSYKVDCQIDDQLVSEFKKLLLDETTSASDTVINKGTVNNPALPIDEHKEDILNTVKTQRVTIIHGETGESQLSFVSHPPHFTYLTRVVDNHGRLRQELLRAVLLPASRSTRAD